MSALLFGVDAVDLDRRCFTSPERERRLAGAVLSDGERRERVSVAVAVAVKEAVVKAVGGRDRPFDWRAVEVVVAEDGALPPQEARHVFESLRTAAPHGSEHWGAVRLGERTAARARALLGVQEQRALRTLAAWRVDRERVVAVATIDEGSERP